MLCTRTLVATLLIAALASVASAATVYDLGSNGRSYQTSLSLTVDGLMLTATGTDNDIASNVASTSKGWGVYAGSKDKWEVDGAKSTEILWLDFDAPVSLESLTFTGLNKKNDWVRIYDENGATIQDVNLALLAKKGAATLDLSALDLAGTKFGFGAVGKKDSFLIKQVSVVGLAAGGEQQEMTEFVVAPVPLPAPVLAGGALLMAMGVTNLYRRLRSQ